MSKVGCCFCASDDGVSSLLSTLSFSHPLLFSHPLSCSLLACFPSLPHRRDKRQTIHPCYPYPTKRHATCIIYTCCMNGHSMRHNNQHNHRTPVAVKFTRWSPRRQPDRILHNSYRMKARLIACLCDTARGQETHSGITPSIINQKEVRRGCSEYNYCMPVHTEEAGAEYVVVCVSIMFTKLGGGGGCYFGL